MRGTHEQRQNHLVPIESHANKKASAVADIRRRVGAVLYGLMDKRGVSAAELARQTGVSQLTASHWRAGKRMPDTSNMLAIARVFDMNLNELLLELQREHAPRFESWQRFQESETYARLTDDERVRVALTVFSEDADPPLAAWLALAEAQMASRPRS